MEQYRKYPVRSVGWDGCYLNLLGKNQIPSNIIRGAMTRYDIKDEKALQRGLSIFRPKDTAEHVLVFAASVDSNSLEKDPAKVTETMKGPEKVNETKKRRSAFTEDKTLVLEAGSSSSLASTPADNSSKKQSGVTRKAAEQLIQSEVKSKDISETAQHSPLKRLKISKQVKAPLCQTVANFISVSREVLEKLIKISSFESSQEHCVVINRFSEKESFASYLKTLRLTQAETKISPLFSEPKSILQNTIVHSILLLGFPQFERSHDQFSKFIFVDLLNENVQSSFGCSHVMTIADVSHGEINSAYPAMKTISEKYEQHLILKGKGIMVALDLYKTECMKTDPEVQVLQLPEIRKDFKPKQFGFKGTNAEFVITSHAILILGMISEMAGPGCTITDSDVRQKFVIKLPSSGNLLQRNEVIEKILDR